MDRTRAPKRVAVAVVAVLMLGIAAGVGAAVGHREPGDRSLAMVPVTLTWWHDGADGPLGTLWAEVADEFERAHPHVSIKLSGHQRAWQRTRPEAGADGPPDLFGVWGGPEFVEQVRAGQLLDLTDLVGEQLELIGAAADPWRFGGRQYGLPYSIGIEGLWYRKSLFVQAGITAPPATLAELTDAVARLKAAGVVPVVVNAESRWPAAHWWQYFVLRHCPPDVLQRSVTGLTFADPCFVAAGQDLTAFVATEPFQPILLSPVATGNASMMLVEGRAAMELMGAWHGGVLRTMAREVGQEEAVMADLGWFPVPKVPGGRGDQSAVLGGGDGFACSAQAPPECVELLKYVMSAPVQARYAGLGLQAPVLGPRTDPPEMTAALANAGHLQLWLDAAVGSTVGSAMNDAAYELILGWCSAQQVVDAMTAAARQA